MARAEQLDLGQAFAAASPLVQRFILRASYRQIFVDDQGTLERHGLGKHHDVYVARTAQRQPVSYEHLVYAVLTLLDPPSESPDTPLTR